MAARVALALSTALLCLVLGWVSAPATLVGTAPARPLRLAALRLEPAAPAAAAAAAALAGAAPPPPGAAAPPAPPRARAAPVALPPPPPPPPQADAVLRASVAAVDDEGGDLDLVLAGGGRRLRAGDRFMGWRLASVTRSGAVLAKGGERREVSFFAPEPAGGGGTPSAFAAAGGVGRIAPARLPPPRPVAPLPRAPTAEEFFRGFKG